MKKGLVSVIMSNYNTDLQCLEAAIQSILAQTYTELEFIIIDDHSTDHSLELIQSLPDERIRIISNKENLGLTKSLNIGLAAAAGEFIARMDADDISEPSRIEKQVEFMRAHPDVIVCGTGVRLIGERAAHDKIRTVYREIPTRNEFRVHLLFGNYPNIVHPTAMFRRELLEKYNIAYNEYYYYAQDYRMWVECSKYGECANVEDCLLQYRIHPKAISAEKRREQLACAGDIIKEQLGWLELELPAGWEELHFGYFAGRKGYSDERYQWIQKLIEHNEQHRAFDQKTLRDMVYRKWAEIVYFGLRGEDAAEKLRRLRTLPLRYWPELFFIWKRRRGMTT